ncbi:MAG: DUF370 domain-containing protein [Alphaproteobacteria bacterium]|nr:DUF370 domain-containing protein [Alphaproteobacteria bacterium]
MYLHLGADCMVKNSDIIAIFDMRSEESTIADEYIKPYKDRYKIVDASGGEECSSCILTEDTLYLSSISSITLKKRACEGFFASAVYINP